MDTNEIWTMLTEAISYVQEESDDPTPEMTDNTCVFDEIENFDSMRAAAVIVIISEQIAQRAGRKVDAVIKQLQRIFAPEKSGSLRLADVMERVSRTIN